jgi:hypothetical protein
MFTKLPSISKMEIKENLFNAENKRKNVELVPRMTKVRTQI